MLHMFKAGLIAATALLLVTAAQASAAVLIDQKNTAFDGHGQAESRIGQSFTAVKPGIDFASFTLSTSGLSTFRLDLRAGSGFAGSLLGSSSLVTLNSPGFTNVTFNFASLIPLSVGGKYTLQLVKVSGGSVFFYRQSTSNPYSGGNMFFGPTSNGTSLSNFDLVFSEGRTAPVPEPAAWAMMIAGFGLIGGAMRRRRRMSVRFA